MQLVCSKMGTIGVLTADPFEVATLARHFCLNCVWKVSLSAMSNHGLINIVVDSS
jgi:hypothetical protein